MERSRRIFMSGGALAFLWTVAAGASFAQEPAQPPASPEVGLDEVPAEEPEYTFGVVKEVSAGQIVLTEFDYDTGDEKDVTYSVGPETEINNVATLAEIKKGDEVDVDYLVQEGKNVAVVISVAQPLEEEESAEPPGAEDQDPSRNPAGNR